MRRLLLSPALLFLVAAAPAFARSSQDHVTVGQNITIAEGESSGDIACIFCSVRVHGNVKGDIAVLFGSVSVDSDQKISGDVAMLGGDLNLAEESQVGGDVAIAGGHAYMAEGAVIRGSSSILPGKIWLLLPFLPLIALAGIIWLIVYLVQRNRYRVPMYPNGRGY
jgi:hypothetical protein